MKKQEFIEEIEALGATKPGDLSYDYKFEIQDTELSVSPHVTSDGDLWVHSRWEDPERAAEILEEAGVQSHRKHHGNLNKYSGKWNSLDPKWWLSKLKKVLALQQKEADMDNKRQYVVMLDGNFKGYVSATSPHIARIIAKSEYGGNGGVVAIEPDYASTEELVNEVSSMSFEAHSRLESLRGGRRSAEEEFDKELYYYGLAERVEGNLVELTDAGESYATMALD